MKTQMVLGVLSGMGLLLVSVSGVANGDEMATDEAAPSHCVEKLQFSAWAREYSIEDADRTATRLAESNGLRICYTKYDDCSVLMSSRTSVNPLVCDGNRSCYEVEVWTLICGK